MKNLLIALLLLTSITSFSQMMPLVTVRCTAVHDGDTFEILWNGVKTKCRILNIDAPELKQDYGLRSRDTLAKYLDKQLVKIQQIQGVKKIDIYGRMLVNVWSPFHYNRLDVLLVATGNVWYDDIYGKYPPSQIAQDKAQLQRRGLFACEDSGTPALRPKLYREMKAYEKMRYKQYCW